MTIRKGDKNDYAKISDRKPNQIFQQLILKHFNQKLEGCQYLGIHTPTKEF